MTSKKRRIILCIVAAVEVLAVAGLGIYAWIEGSTSPQLQATEVKIVSSPGITMLLNGDPQSVININQYLGDMNNDFYLTEASSNDGRHIFIRDDSFNVADDDTLIFVRDANSVDINNTYIEMDFTLKADEDSDEYGPGGPRSIWLDPSKCYVYVHNGQPNPRPTDVVNPPEDEPIVPVRVSISYYYDGDDPNTVRTFIFGMDRPADEPAADGKTSPVEDYYPTTEGGHYYHQAIYSGQPQNVLSFASYAPGRAPLFTLAVGQTAKVTVRVWLEGADPLCVDDPAYGVQQIAGGTFDFLLYFTTVDENGD